MTRPLLIAMLLALATPAGAQVGDPPIPPRALAYSLERQGYDLIATPRLAGGAYVVDVLDPDGLRVRLVIDAFDGTILRRRSLEDALPDREVHPWDREDENQPRRSARPRGDEEPRRSARPQDEEEEERSRRAARPGAPLPGEGTGSIERPPIPPAPVPEPDDDEVIKAPPEAYRTR